MATDRHPIYGTLVFLGILLAALLTLQPYSADWPGSLYSDPARRYIRAAMRQDSAALARLLPGAAAQLAPALAQYISAPGAAEQVFRLLKTHADLAPPLLNELAANPRNADLLVSLSSTVPAGAAASAAPAGRFTKR